MIKVRKILCISFFFLFIFKGTSLVADDFDINEPQTETQEKRLQEIQEELKRKKAGEAAVRKKEEKNLAQIREKSKEHGKPVFMLWQSRDVNPDPTVSALLRKANMVSWNARRAARIMRHLVWYKQYLDMTRSG